MAPPPGMVWMLCTTDACLPSEAVATSPIFWVPFEHGTLTSVDPEACSPLAATPPSRVTSADFAPVVAQLTLTATSVPVQ